jgi:UDP-N-acetylglucosamine/UDP-N-acetylgalactosamine diphosphorylase
MHDKVLLETKSRVAVAPHGNGNLYAALRTPLLPTSKSWAVLSNVDSRRALYMHAHCVDNCLVRIADLVFVSYGISELTAPPR